MKTNNTTTTNVSNLLTAAAYVRNETIINGNQAAQLDAMIGQIKDLMTKIEAVPAKIADLAAQGKEKAVAMWERMAARYRAQFADAIAELRAWLVDFKANRPNVQINLDEPEDHEPTDPDNTPTTMNTTEIIASLNENQVRTAAARLLPDKLFDEYFTPECGNIALLRQILEDHVLEYETTAAEIIEAAGADETANETKAPEFSQLSHAATNIVLAAENTCNIYQNHVDPLVRSLERKAAKGVTLLLDTLAKSYAMAVIIRESIKEIKRTSYGHFSANTEDRRAAALYLANIYIGEL